MSPARTPHGLRVTVWLHDVVVSQCVRWPQRGTLQVGVGSEDAIPTPTGGPLVEAQWLSSDRVTLRSVAPGTHSAVIGREDAWGWDNGEGVRVRLDLVAHQPARRRGTAGSGGDVALLTLMLMLTVGMNQLTAVLERMFPPGGAGAGADPTPELIARLLSRDLDGAEDGLPERSEQREFEVGAQSFYMPAGNDGPLSRSGGGARTGLDVRRNRQPAEPDPAPVPELPTPGEEEPNPLPQVQIAQVEEGLPAVEELAAMQARAARASSTDLEDQERFEGWGFSDWFEVKDARTQSDRDQMLRILEVARNRMKIDPDDPSSIQVIGYYSYLSEEYPLCEETYRRFLELYPDEPAGYNNLALVYKRKGDYGREEALYRQALALEPLDPNVMNNLAVNLAHQGRFDEALRIMETLEDLDPGDPYADLHRAKVYAAMGKRERSYHYLAQALEGMAALDTLHHIEFRQDLRIDPVFEGMRDDSRFARLLHRYYGESADYLLSSKKDHRRRKAERGSNG